MLRTPADEAPAAAPVVCDIGNWAELDEYRASNEVTAALRQKGFCFIGGFADEYTTAQARKEAKSLKSAGAMRCTPQEATGVLLGPCGSYWTMELTSPPVEAPQSEENLRVIDGCLQQVGCATARHERPCAAVAGRHPGLLHHSRMLGDGPAPGLRDRGEATEYLRKATSKMVVLLYYLGPNAAVISIAPRGDADKIHHVVAKQPVVLAYLNDVCLLTMNMRGAGITVEVDLALHTHAGPSDELPAPVDLHQWFLERFQAVADDDVATDDVSFNFQREAGLRIHKTLPVRIVGLRHELPSLPQSGGGNTPFEASLLGGHDPVTEISKRHDDQSTQSGRTWASTWDPEEFYDANPAMAMRLKMYTRHFAVLSEYELFNPAFFGISPLEEDAIIDHRAKMMLLSVKGCILSAKLDLTESARKDIGFFVGVCGENPYWDLMQGQATINKFSAQNLGRGSIANRLSYHLQCNGPAVSLDTEESSGMAALDAAVASLRENRCGPLSFASSCHLLANPLESVLQCAAGLVSQSGRTRVCDETADGFTKGEGIVTLLLECRGEAREDEEPVLITGSRAESKGAAASFAAPSPAAFTNVIMRAAKDACKPFYIVDAVELNGSGAKLNDAVEMLIMHKLLEVGTRNTQAVPMRASRSTYGNLGPVCGLVAVARSCALLLKALHGPMLHLRQLSDVACPLPDDEPEMGQRLFLPLETIEARGSTQVVGVSAFGTTGTNCHGLLVGSRREEAADLHPARPLSWWPGGPPEVAPPPVMGYYIVGTWTAWNLPCKMQEEEEGGIHGYTLTMGENNWERFQVWLDEDPEQVLHPGQPRAQQEAKIQGPDRNVDRELSWHITGRKEEVRLLNEVQFARRQTGQEELPCARVFPGDHRPPGFENAEDESGMPLVDVNERNVGAPGDEYRIRLHVRGKYRRLEWFKLAVGPRAAEDACKRCYKHEYHSIGDHNHWVFEAMKSAEEEEEEGLHIVEVQLLQEHSKFQIYRDADWEQGFYPATEAASAEAEVLGPASGGCGKHWQLVGKVGDRFRLDFRRRRVDGEDYKTLRWSFLGSSTVDIKDLATCCRYYVVGSWTGFDTLQEMERNELNGNLSFEVTLDKSGMASFQILINGTAAVHPRVNHASMYDGDQILEGPDNAGAGKYWTIGKHHEDCYAEGEHVLIHLDIEGGLPRRVWWEKYESWAAHQAYLAKGCTRIFDRHCKLLGFEPYQSPERPARQLRLADFLRPGAAEQGLVGATTMPPELLRLG